MTNKQKRFCEEYVIDLNATQAAIRAGYMEGSAQQSSTTNMSNPLIMDKITHLQADISDRNKIKVDQIVQELSSIAFDDISNYLDYECDVKGKPIIRLKDSKTIDTKNVSEISLGKDGQFKFKMYSRDTALVNLGKHLGMFIDRVAQVEDPVIMVADEETKQALEGAGKPGQVFPLNKVS